MAETGNDCAPRAQRSCLSSSVHGSLYLFPSSPHKSCTQIHARSHAHTHRCAHTLTLAHVNTHTPHPTSHFLNVSTLSSPNADVWCPSWWDLLYFMSTLHKLHNRLCTQLSHAETAPQKETEMPCSVEAKPLMASCSRHVYCSNAM